MEAAPVTTVLVLGGGPDAERPVSLTSARAVASALASTYEVHFEAIGRLDQVALSAMSGEVIFPVLHGPYGEGGPLQDLLENDGRPFVGSRAAAARACMDKIATKLISASLGIATPRSGIFDPRDDAPPFTVPFVVKPTHDGSSVGLHICHSLDDWVLAREAVRADIAANPYRSYLVERFVRGRELTVGLLGFDGQLDALPIVEIAPAAGVYDYQAKYERTDTRYIVSPDLPEQVAQSLAIEAVRLAREIGVRDLARVDFVLDTAGNPWLLEVNTMPGFTPSSLLPKAAAARGLTFDQLCAHLLSQARHRS